LVAVSFLTHACVLRSAPSSTMQAAPAPPLTLCWRPISAAALMLHPNDARHLLLYNCLPNESALPFSTRPPLWGSVCIHRGGQSGGDCHLSACMHPRDPAELLARLAPHNHIHPRSKLMNGPALHPVHERRSHCCISTRVERPSCRHAPTCLA
jgi:hypothetical protein